MQAAMLLILIVFLWKKRVTPQSRNQECYIVQQQVKVMIHYENGESRVKTGIVKGDLKKAIEGKAKAYLHTNGDKYVIAPKSLYSNGVLHIMDRNKPEPEENINADEPQEKTEEIKLGLTPQEAEYLFGKYKNLDPEDAHVLLMNYLEKKRKGEVKQFDK